MATPAWFQAAHPGDRALVCYFQGAGGAAMDGSKWVAISRDFDIFEEDFAEADGLRQFLANGQLPAALRGLPHFLIDHYQFGADRQHYMETGEALARGLRPAAPVAPGPAPGGGGPGALVPAEGAAPLVEKWFALEGQGIVQAGDALTAALGAVEFSSNDRRLFKLLDGAVLSGGLEGTLPVAPGAAGGDDSHILPAKRDGQRRFRRSFASALQDMQLVEFADSWEIEGPRSAYFTAERIHDGNHRPVQRHYWWRSVMGLSATDVGVDEHLLLSQLIEVAMAVGQVQICNLATFELVSRQYQMWESAYKDLLRVVDTGGSGGDDWLNERSLFLGVKNLRSSAIIMPELEDFVAKELASRAAVLKERRKAFSPPQQMRQRDVLPISLAVASEEGWLFEGIRALNELGAPQPPATSPAALTSAQVSAVRHLARQYGSVAAPPPDCGSALGAWQSLQGSRPGYADDALAVGARATFERGNASLPAGLSGRVSLSECLPPALQSALGDPSILLSEGEAAVRRDSFDGSLFLDPVLRDNPRLFGEFVSELWDAGVVEVSDDVLEERGDVEVCYYQFALPEQYRCFFGLPSLPIAHLSPALVASLPDAVRERGWARLRARVAPIGWNWDVALVQAANQYQLDGVSPEAPCLLDKVPPPPLGDVGSLRGLYIDNFVSLSQSKSVATSDVLGMQSRLADLGIASTLESSEAGGNDFIGFTLLGSSGEWRPKASRFWRSKLASDYLLEARPSITGQELERFVGHVTALFSLSPELLCLMEKVYVFIHESYTRRQPLWPSVHREVRWIRALLPLARASMRRPWSSRVFGYDASCWGFGVGSVRWEPGEVAAVGRVRERARFRGLLSVSEAPRSRALEHQEELEISGASEANILGLGRARAFAEVLAGLVERCWTGLRWPLEGGPRAQVHLGARAQTWTVRHVARDCGLHNSRVLLLGDNLSVIFAHAKGRSSTPAMNFQCRLASATALAVSSFATGGSHRNSTPWTLRAEFTSLVTGAKRRWQSTSGTGCLPPARLRPAAPSDSDDEGAAGLGFSSSRSAGAPTDRGPAARWVSSRLERLRVATRARLRLLAPLLTGLQQERVRPATQAGYCDVLEPLADILGRRPLPTLSGPQWDSLLFNFAEWTLIMFETYMRPSELLSLTVGQLVPPTASRGQGAFWGCCVRVEELGRPSKTQEFDLSVLLDLDRHRLPIPVLQALQGGRASGGSLSDVSSRHLYRSFALAVEQVGDSCIVPSLYALRHGGASHDRLVRARSLAEVQQRGHWRSFQSVVRDGKHAQVSLQLDKLAAALRNQISPLVDRGLMSFAVHYARLLHSRIRTAAGSS
ncbi:unnamed protein product [Prorocentrum cordatum]|uniref:Uncharacterized protein n=1 Tax=Prorocentrum cordatum TaxID=2364126 RepID=A0ABN9RUU7_9DINO|nr:unnamed protein product [Polarella glacialis]